MKLASAYTHNIGKYKTVAMYTHQFNIEEIKFLIRALQFSRPTLADQTVTALNQFDASNPSGPLMDNPSFLEQLRSDYKMSEYLEAKLQGK